MNAESLPTYYNATAILAQNLPVRADKIAIYSDERTLRFSAVAAEANQVGNALTALGVRFGEHVAILAPDSAEWATVFFGTIKIGAIAVGLNTELEAYEYDYILRDSRVRVLVVHERLLASVEAIRNELPALQHVVVIGRPRRTADRSFRAWIEGQPAHLDPAPTHRDDFCSLHYTSGATGQPKGMYHAHKDYALIAQNTGVDLFGITQDDRTFSVAKLFFVYGLGGNLILPWYVGASIVLHAGSGGLTASVLETIERFQPTILFSVPSAYLNMLSIADVATRYDLSSPRLCVSAGEALSATLWQRWREATGLEILDTIGCTETFHTFMANRPSDLRPGSSGRPSPGYEVKIVDDAGDPTAPGEIGNLMVRGESLALFYLHQYTQSRHAFRGEWLFTGDRYYMDADGFYWHAGRADDMFKVGGLWVSPVEVEAVLSAHPAVLECAVVAAQGKNNIAKAKAYIRLQQGYEPSNDLIRALLRHCGNELAAHKCPRWFEFLTELPKTATGKIQRFRLRCPESENLTRHGE